MQTSCDKREPGAEPVLLESKMPAYVAAPRAGLLEEAWNSLFFCVLSHVSCLSFWDALCWSPVSTDCICSDRDASLKECKARTCLISS